LGRPVVLEGIFGLAHIYNDFDKKRMLTSSTSSKTSESGGSCEMSMFSSAFGSFSVATCVAIKVCDDFEDEGFCFGGVMTLVEAVDDNISDRCGGFKVAAVPSNITALLNRKFEMTRHITKICITQ